MRFFKRKFNTKKLVKIYIDLLDKEINESIILIHSVEKNANNLSDEIKINELMNEIEFIKVEVQIKLKVVRDLNIILKNKNLMNEHYYDHLNLKA